MEFIKKEIFDLFQFYPGWVQLVFLATVAGLFASVVLGFVYRGEAKHEQRLASIGVRLLPPPTTSSEQLDARRVTYRHSSRASDDGVLIIEPVVSWLERDEAAGPHEAMPWQTDFVDYRPAAFDVVLTNDSSRTLTITSVELVVTRSEPVRAPLLVACEQLYDAFHIKLVNLGWAPARDVQIAFSLGRTEEEAQASGDFAFTREIGSVDLEETIWVQDEITSVDPTVDIHGLALTPFTLIELDRAGIEDDRLGTFKDGLARMHGLLSYTDDTGGRWEHEFTSLVPLAPKGPGKPLEVSAEYDALLRADGAEYAVPLVGSPGRHVLESGKADSIRVRVAAEMSSRHEFVLRVHTAEGLELSSGPVVAEIAVARGKALRHASSESPSN